jgi:hypothetical protein
MQIDAHKIMIKTDKKKENAKHKIDSVITCAKKHVNYQNEIFR